MNGEILRRVFLSCALILALAVPGVDSMAAEFTVCASGCDYDTIQGAVDAASSGDSIQLGAETFLEQNVLILNKNLTLRGAGSELTVVDAGGVDRVFGIFGSEVLLGDMTIRNGNRTPGGGIYSGGADTVVTLENCVLRDNVSAIGGGAYLDWSRMVIANSTIADNLAQSGGAIFAAWGHLVITDSIVSTNVGEYSGAGIEVSGAGATARVERCTIAENRILHPWGHGWDGAGFSVSGDAENPPSVEILDSTIVGNETPGAYGRGGGICSRYEVQMRIVNSTITGNSAAVEGGGLFLSNDGAQAITIRNSTITGNGAPLGAGLATDSLSATPTVVEHSVVAANLGDDCSGSAIASAGHNLSGDASCGFTEPGDLEETAPLLLPLADNGGPTRTHLPDGGSPAIDGGGVECEPLDQRGVVRPQDGDGDGEATCDIGAVEIGIQSLTVTIDIKPSSSTNSINPGSQGLVEVALLGSETLAVESVDVATLRFGPLGAEPAHDLTDPAVWDRHLEDVNLDGWIDLVSHYRTAESGIFCGDAEAALSGATLSGASFEGVDSIRTVGCPTAR